MRNPVFVFDWDGTLLDSKLVKRESFCLAIAEFLRCKFGHSVSMPQLFTAFERNSGHPREVVVSRIIHSEKYHASEIEIQRICDNISALIGLKIDRCRMFPDAIETLRFFGRCNISMSISSSVPQTELHHLVGAILPIDLREKLNPILGSDGLSRKGSPHFSRVCEHYGCDYDNLIFVGDDHADHEIAKNCNVKFVRIDRLETLTEYKTSIVIRSLRHLRDIPIKCVTGE